MKSSSQTGRWLLCGAAMHAKFLLRTGKKKAENEEETCRKSSISSLRSAADEGNGEIVGDSRSQYHVVLLTSRRAAFRTAMPALDVGIRRCEAIGAARWPRMVAGRWVAS